MISKMLNASLNLKTLIENFAPDDDLRHALLLTYNFDGGFLEDAEHGLLETLWRRNCENLIVVRDGKGMKDRVTVLPDSLVAPLHEHLQRVKLIHRQDLSRGYGSVYLPYALERKYPNAGREW